MDSSLLNLVLYRVIFPCHLECFLYRILSLVHPTLGPVYWSQNPPGNALLGHPTEQLLTNTGQISNLSFPQLDPAPSWGGSLIDSQQIQLCLAHLFTKSTDQAER